MLLELHGTVGSLSYLSCLGGGVTWSKRLLRPSQGEGLFGLNKPLEAFFVLPSPWDWSTQPELNLTIVPNFNS